MLWEILLFGKKLKELTHCIYFFLVNGYKEQISISKYDKDKVAQWVGLLKGRSGLQIQRLRKDWHTETPSIQGIWHPFMFKDTKLSVTDLRDPELHEYDSAVETATERLLELKNVHVDNENVDSTPLDDNKSPWVIELYNILLADFYGKFVTVIEVAGTK